MIPKTRYLTLSYHEFKHYVENHYDKKLITFDRALTQYLKYKGWTTRTSVVTLYYNDCRIDGRIYRFPIWMQIFSTLCRHAMSYQRGTRTRKSIRVSKFLYLLQHVPAIFIKG